MTWLISIFLITVACYLIMQGLSERQLFQKSSSDSDEVDDDLYMTISKRLNPEPIEGDMTIADENSVFARAVHRVQEKSNNASERLERKIEGFANNPKESLYDRTLAKVTAVSAKADEKLEQKIAATKQNSASASIAEDDSKIGRIVTKVSATLSKTEDKFQERIDRSTQIKAEKLTEESGFFANAVSRVATGLESIDQRVDDKLAATRVSHNEQTSLSSNDDFFSRVASKVGDRVNNVDDKLIAATNKRSDDSSQR